ncbi:MAG TPA: flavoprotein [Streptomyces sp.]
MKTAPKVPTFQVERLLLVATGALTVSFLPSWVHWLHRSYPSLTTRIVITHSAERFVSRQALGVLSGEAVLRDEWPEDATAAMHVELAQWAEAAIVFPATMHYTSRLALGLADTPSLLTLQSTTVPIGLAPALPPGIEKNQAFAKHLHDLAQRPNVVIAPSVSAPSATTGQRDTRGSGPLWELMHLVEQRRHVLANDAS